MSILGVVGDDWIFLKVTTNMQQHKIVNNINQTFNKSKKAFKKVFTSISPFFDTKWSVVALFSTQKISELSESSVDLTFVPTVLQVSVQVVSFRFVFEGTGPII